MEGQKTSALLRNPSCGRDCRRDSRGGCMPLAPVRQRGYRTLLYILYDDGRPAETARPQMSTICTTLTGPIPPVWWQLNLLSC